MDRKVRLYALSTCGWCAKVKSFLGANNIAYEGVDVDLLAPEEKERVRAEVGRHNPRYSYPTIVVDDKEVVIGFDETRLREIFGL